MTRPVIIIATPCFGGVVTQSYTMSLLRLTQRAMAADFEVDYLMLNGDSLISRARSVLVSHVLANPRATHLMFVDADIAFAPAQFERLLRFDKDFVAGMYPLKGVDWSGLTGRVVAGEPIRAAALNYVGTPCTGDDLRVEDGFATAQYAGTGFQLLRRSVFERMIAAYPELKFASVHAATNQRAPQDHLYALFDCIIDPDTRAYLSEDYSFCRRWRAIGGDIWLDLESRLTHTGASDFVGDSRERFAALAAQAKGAVAAGDASQRRRDPVLDVKGA